MNALMKKEWDLVLKKKHWKRIALPVALAASLLAGCSMGAGDSKKESEPTTLRVMYYDERSFFDQYGMLFSALHPEVEIEVINTQSVKYEEGKDMDAEMLKFIDEQKPDIVMLSPDQYTKMSEQGKLLELDTRIEEKSFDKAGLLPGMIDYMKELSGGKLYGLVPSFYSQAIYYNKDLFTKYGVELPKDKMSWDDLLRLAAMFPTTGSKEDRVYGLKMGYMSSDLYQMASTIGNTQNLNFIDPTGTKITLNSDAWKKTFETALSALKSNALYTEEPNFGGGAMSQDEWLLQDPFVAGKVAMTFEGTYLMDQIKQAQASAAVKDKAVKNWDLVTMPVDPANPDVSPNMSFYNIFAISATSAQTKAAWTFMSYVHSDEFARVSVKRQQGMMPVRTKYLSDKEGHRFEAFYSLKPIVSPMYKNYSKIPQDFWMSFNGLSSQELKPVVDDQKPLADALNSLQTKAQEALDQAYAKKKNDPKSSEGGTAAESGASSSSSTTSTVVISNG